MLEPTIYEADVAELYHAMTLRDLRLMRAGFIADLASATAATDSTGATFCARRIALIEKIIRSRGAVV